MPHDETVREQQQTRDELRSRIRKYERRTGRYMSLSIQALTTMLVVWLIDWQMHTEGLPGYRAFDVVLDVVPLLAIVALAFTLVKLLMAYLAGRRATEKYRERQGAGA